MKITSSLFDAYIKCPTKCYLRSLGETGSGNVYADWLRTQNESYRSDGVKRLIAEAKPSECTIGPTSIENMETAKWRLVVDVVISGKSLESTLQVLERVPSEGQDQPALFISVRFNFTNKITIAEKLLMAFDAVVLSESLGREVNLGKIVHGDAHATLQVKTSDLAKESRKLAEKIAMLLSSSSSPDLILNRHCAKCEFQAQCRQKATEKDDLSLLFLE